MPKKQAKPRKPKALKVRRGDYYAMFTDAPIGVGVAAYLAGPGTAVKYTLSPEQVERLHDWLTGWREYFKAKERP